MSENGDGEFRHPASVLQDLLLQTEYVEDFLQELVVVAGRTVGEGLSVGATLVRDGGPTTVASTDERTSTLDEIQYSYGQGPCLTAMRTGDIVLVPDLTRVGDEFGDYPAAALAAGVRSILALPFGVADGSVGALNVYADEPDRFGDRDVEVLRMFADESSRALGLALRLCDQTRLTEQLRAALMSRTVIDQATGIIMAENRCGPDEAFDVLRSTSQHRNIKLREVAAAIVRNVAGASSDGGSEMGLERSTAEP